MQFGQAARNRQLQSVGAATSFLPASRSGFDPVQVALGRPSINTGQSQFLGVQQPSGESTQAGMGVFNQFAGFQNQFSNLNSQRRDGIDRMNETVSAAGSVLDI